MSLERDPLVVEDPHEYNRETIETWIKFDSDAPPSETYAEPITFANEMSSRLRTRKPNKSDASDDTDSTEWMPKIQRKRGKKWSSRKRDDNESETDSDSENIVPAKTDDNEDFGGASSSSCNVCHKTFGSVSLLNEHVSNSCRRGFSCCGCSNAFDDAKSLADHLRTCRNGEVKKESKDRQKNGRCRKYYEQLKTERKYQCEVCHKAFITSGHLNTHMFRHSGKKWTCDGCGKNFSCERSLMRHKDTFPREHSFSCKHCDVTFFRAVNLAKHMEIKHPEAVASDGQNQRSEEFLCKLCLKSFLTSEMLIVHKEAMHSSEDDTHERVDRESESEVGNVMRFRCEVCGKEFVSLEGFEYHTANQHVFKDVKKKKKQQPQPAPRAFNLDDDSANDAETTTSSFACKICSATFPTKSTLQTHLKSHNVTKNMEVKSGSHQCCICPRSFSSSDGLKYHLATHTGERRYSCGQCGKRFIKKTHLSEHVATHSEVKYFKCPRCPRTFSTHSAYRKHMKHFPGPHSFPCRKCGKLFTKESMIEKHMCVDLMKITMAPEVKALLSEDMIEEYLCLAEEQMAEEISEKTPHSCYKCFKVFPSLTALQSHQNDHIGKQSYQCRFCPETFKRADAFGAHIRNHLGSTPYMCLKCNRKFISPFTLSMHAKNYPGEHSFTCQKCQRWFPSEKRLERHECILESSDTFRCACGLAFSSWKELLSHAGVKPYKCCACDFTYPTLTALARHIKKHTGVKPFTCEMCGKSFRARNNYLSHKNIHRDVAEIQCEHCEYKSKSRKRMDFHLFRKHDIGSNVAKSTLCPVCGVIFPYTSQMKKHMELDHGSEVTLNDAPGDKKSLPPELCTLCGKMLNNKYTLANHMKKVHDPNAGKKVVKELKCEFCDERFHTVRKLQRHAEIHEAPGLRTCDICQKEFYFAKELRKHMRRHDTNKPFSCPRCGKHFKVAVSLKYHSTICGQRSGAGRKRKARNEVNHNQHLPPQPQQQQQEPLHDHSHQIPGATVATVDPILYSHVSSDTSGIDLNNQPYIVQVYGT